MAGKAYTMREMRDIVAYINERKAYGELKGRKMWMEFANSNKTTRTWQSLKETFLKRILPDIQNPYYKQTLDQVRSFRAGVDVVEKEKNKLEIRETIEPNVVTSEDQNGLSTINNNMPTASLENEGTKNNNEPSTTSLDEELEKVTGEDIKAAKIPSRCRSSADTIVLEYENAEDVQRILESPKNPTETKSISLRDKISFEPLSPFVQDVINEFDTESDASDPEPRLKIAEGLPKTNNESEAIVEDTIEQNKPSKNNIADSEDTLEIPDSTAISDRTSMQSKTMENVAVTREDSNKDHQNKIVNHKKLDSPNNSNEHDKNETTVNSNETVQQDSANNKSNNEDTTVIVTEEANAKSHEKLSLPTKTNSSIVNTEGSTQNITYDSLLPNNQEALDSNIQKAKHAETDEVCDKARKESKHVKRSSLADSRSSKKKKMTKSTKIQAASVIEIDDSSSTSNIETGLETVNTSNNEVNSVIMRTEEKFNMLIKQTLDNKKSTSVENDVPNTNMNKEKVTIKDKSPSILNVNKQNNNHSDCDPHDVIEENTDKPRTETNKPKEVEDISHKTKERNDTEAMNKHLEVVVLNENKEPEVDRQKNSGSDCEIQHEKVVNKNQDNSTFDLQRERALANVFGFAHGGATFSKKRRLSHRRRSHHRRRVYSNNTESYSSDWTSQSDSDSYISPPGGHRSRQTKKYLKPKSSRVLQDPDDGKLYVIFGKKMYPILKDGKHIKKFVIYKPDSGTDEDESFWRKKYIEEKKRNEEVKKLLEEAQRDGTAQVNELASTSHNARSPQKIAQIETSSVDKNNAIAPQTECKTEAKNDKIIFKIAAKNGLEYCLEGGWTQISNAMPEVVKMLRYEPVDERKVKPANSVVDQPKPDVGIVIASRPNTPVSVAEAVTIRETEIFNEIESKHAQEVEEEVKPSEVNSVNVTRRPGRPRKVPLPSGAAKRTRSSKSNSIDSKQDEPKTKRVSKRKLNVPDDNQNERDVNTTEPHTDAGVKEKKDDGNKNLSLRRSNSRVSRAKDLTEQNNLKESHVSNRTSARLLRTPKKNDIESPISDVNVLPPTSNDITGAQDSDENEVRYKLAPVKTNRKTPGSNYRSLPEIKIISPQEKLGYLIDSTYGYQDSDDTILKYRLPKRKKRISVMVRNKYKKKRVTRRSCPILLQASSDTNSSYFVPLKRSLFSLKSEVCISDSYRLLMPKQNPVLKKLKRIDENNPDLDVPDVRHFSSISKDSNKSCDIGNSSNMSLPPSPELSIVENMSISRDIIKEANHPTINEVQQNLDNQAMDYSEFVISNLDISVPLMDQKCKLQKNTDGTNLTPNVTTESTQLKDCTVDITLSETLDRRLRALLLESNKKPNQTDKQTPMEVDQTVVTANKFKTHKQKENIDINENVPAKNTRAKKRSSTPRKKKTVTKSKAPQNPIIEEEHIESCAAGRKSCPPVLTFIPVDENANNNHDVILNHVKGDKKKKDIIKVKILKPKEKNRSKANLRGKSVGSDSIASTLTDSGINDTETISVILKDSSVDLIHNHSETCLMANECIDSDSVEFIENSPNVIVSLNSSRRSEDSISFTISEKAVTLSEDTSSSRNNIVPEQNEVTFESPVPKYLSPVGSNSSLITEDLSNSPLTRSSKWYLLDEDVTSMEIPNMNNFGSNLKQIFPITCAVPNLSTISEASKENEDSTQASGSLQHRLRKLFEL